MAQDAVPAYDQVVYVGADQIESPKAMEAKTVATAPVRAAAKKTAVKAPTTKAATPMPPAVAKKAVTKKASTKKTTAVPSDAVTVSRILTAVPNLQSGQWQPLGDVAKLLHDEKLLAKSATSTKLFKKFSNHFELVPSGKPNKVRFIFPPH